MPTVQQIFDIAGSQLQDAGATTWTPTKLLRYFNLGVVEICNLKPEAYPVTKVITLIAGATQFLDDSAIELLDAVCNMGTSGIVPGRNVRILAKEAVDLLLPDWQTYPAGTVVLFIMIDSRNPKNFYTIPPVSTATPKPRIKIIQAEMPDEVTDPAEDSPLDASYTPALVDYVIYRALAEETTIPNAQEKAKSFLGKFMQDLGLKTAIEKSTEQKEKGNVDHAQ